MGRCVSHEHPISERVLVLMNESIFPWNEPPEIYYITGNCFINYLEQEAVLTVADPGLFCFSLLHAKVDFVFRCLLTWLSAAKFFTGMREC